LLPTILHCMSVKVAFAANAASKKLVAIGARADIRTRHGLARNYASDRCCRKRFFGGSNGFFKRHPSGGPECAVGGHIISPISNQPLATLARTPKSAPYGQTLLLNVLAASLSDTVRRSFYFSGRLHLYAYHRWTRHILRHRERASSFRFRR
jgi:hypothetical protein